MKNPLSRLSTGSRDMTVGKPWKALFSFSIPLLLGNMIQQLYNTVDSVIVGKFVGPRALAAVGTSFPALMLLLAVFLGIATGAGIMVSQYYGAKDEGSLSKTIHTALGLSLVLGGIISVAGYFFVPTLLRWLNTPADVFAMAQSYLQIIFLGHLASLAYNMLSAILRGMGDSTTPLIFLIIASILNIILDLLFVIVFDMGVGGAALATIIAQGMSAIFGFFRFRQLGGVLRIRIRKLWPDRFSAGRMLKLGMPTGIQHASFSIANLLVQSLINGFGYVIMAGANVVMRVDMFAMMPIFTFGMAMTMYTGQNVGAQRMDRVLQGVKDGLRMSVLVSVVLISTILIFGRYLMVLFTDDAEVVRTGVHILRIISFGYLGVTFNNILSGVMRGAGETMMPMAFGIFTNVVVRIPLAFLLVKWTGVYDGIFYSQLVTWVLGALITAGYYRKGTWRKKAVVRRAPT